MTHRSARVFTPAIPSMLTARRICSSVASVLFLSIKKENSSLVLGIRLCAILVGAFRLQTASSAKWDFSSTPTTALAYVCLLLGLFLALEAILLPVCSVSIENKDVLYERCVLKRGAVRWDRN